MSSAPQELALLVLAHLLPALLDHIAQYSSPPTGAEDEYWLRDAKSNLSCGGLRMRTGLDLFLVTEEPSKPAIHRMTPAEKAQDR